VLLERETIDREDLDLLLKGKALPPLTPAPPPAPPAATLPPKADTLPQRKPILGAPPAEPMGA
jgi:hypothetical protein